MISASIIGATGYAGTELLRILSAHPSVSIKTISSHSYAGQRYGDVYENYRHCELICEEENIEKLAADSDILFLALPHGAASEKINAELLKKTCVIDLGADFRLEDADVYEKWYNTPANRGLISESVYGLCEINRGKIAGNRLIANPGCYTTAAILSLYPLLKEKLIDPKSIIIDSKSGVSGAGRGVSLGVHFCETNESVKAYKLASHRHTPEIEAELSKAFGEDITVTFTPHLIPMNRGILSTSYAALSPAVSRADIKQAFRKFYGDEYFIRLCGGGIYPETRWVRGSNFCDIGFEVDERTGKLIVVAALDNLVKGAAGQAVQNMNILFGLDEKTGLDFIPPFPA